MKLFLVCLVSVFLLQSCRSIRPPKQVDLSVSADSAVIGDSIRVAWSVIDADQERFTTKLNGQQVDLQGSQLEYPEIGNRLYILNVNDGDSVVASKRVSVRVVNKPVPEKKEEQPISTPIAEEPHTEKSGYAKGLVNYKPGVASQLTASIFSADVRDFPNKVRLFVSVRDQYGNLVANLAPPYNNQHRSFWQSVSEGYAGENHSIDTFTVTEVRVSTSQGRNVCFVADYSGSMSNNTGDLEAALDLASQRLHSADEQTLVQFDDRVFLVGQNVAGTNRIQRIPFTDLGGATAFYGASVVGLSSMNMAHQDRIAILFTDGYDNSSYNHSAFDVANVSFKSGIRTFVIGFGSADSTILKAIALNSNGKYYLPQTADELADVYEEIFREFETYYVIEYRSKMADATHDVSVRIKPEGQEPVTFKGSFVERPKPILETGRRYMAGQFASGTASLRNAPAWKSKIDTLVTMWRSDTTKKILVIAHSDTRGNERANRNLSKRRAAIIKSEIVKRGVPASVIILDGKGEDEPIYPVEQNRQQLQENRRVEVSFI